MIIDILPFENKNNALFLSHVDPLWIIEHRAYPRFKVQCTKWLCIGRISRASLLKYIM